MSWHQKEDMNISTEITPASFILSWKPTTNRRLILFCLTVVSISRAIVKLTCPVQVKRCNLAISLFFSKWFYYLHLWYHTSEDTVGDWGTGFPTKETISLTAASKVGVGAKYRMFITVLKCTSYLWPLQCPRQCQKLFLETLTNQCKRLWLASQRTFVEWILKKQK